MASVNFNDEEADVMDNLLACYRAILGWNLVTNTTELTHAVHTIQYFIIQHMLIRISPTEWSSWYANRLSE